MSDKIKSIFTSRRFWATFAGLLFMFTSAFGLDLSQEQILGVVLAIAAWVVGDSLRETKNG